MSFSPLDIALLRLEALSYMVTKHGAVKGASSLRTTIEKIFEDHLKNLDIYDEEGYVYASISFQRGSMTVIYEKGETFKEVLQLLNLEYEGGRCEQSIGIPVPEFFENLEVLRDSDWFSDGNNGKPLDEAGKVLLKYLRRLGTSPEFRADMIPINDLRA